MSADLHVIAGWVQPALFLLDVEVRDRRHALETVARAVAEAHGLDWNAVFAGLWRREEAASTALGNGFAIPHARSSVFEVPETVFLRTTAPVPFKAPDGIPVAEFLAILVPTNGDKEDHLRLLALVVDLFSDPSFRAALHGAASASDAAEVFRSGIARAVSRQRAA